MPYKNPEDDKACRLRNRHKKLAYMKKYRLANLDRERARAHQWKLDNPERFRADQKAYAKANPQVKKRAVRKYQAKMRLDPNWIKEQSRKATAWRKANPERAKATGRRFHKKHYSEGDANYIIKTRLRARLTKKLKSRGIRKTVDTMALTGCTADFLRGYLEARFEKGMTWKTVHIDHHIPCAEFDLRDPAQQRQCFHYSNLKPMWGVDNISKGAKRPATHQAELI